MDRRLINHLAFEMANDLLGLVGDCIRPEEHRDAFECFFEECKAGLEAYEENLDRTHTRLKPSLN